ncbi:synaptic vesicle glycoprotein 2C-like isoform X2 [Convolutriloba macropyga]|uniref:synaptic vesicle glycoprotein 2C-like isoform X2 n=1 Tax=Convolutriloba macropyga TaxID=536237 RepID=UPI003F521FB6
MLSSRGRSMASENERLSSSSNHQSTLIRHGSTTCRSEGSDDSDDDGWRSKDYEDALHQAGFGRFQYALALICGWANASDAVEILSVSFILSPAQCAMNLSSGEKGVLSSIVFVGMMIGGYLWGFLADKNGRRQVLMTSLTVNAFFAIVSSLCQTYWWFLLFRFLSGVGVGGSIPVVFSYFAEFQPKQHRGKMISVVAFFWMCGNIVAAALAWIVIPRDWGYQSDDGFDYPSWRIYITVCTLPSLTSAILFFILPESPKYLVHRGEEMKALRVLSLVYSINKRSPRYCYPVKSILLEDYNSSRFASERSVLQPQGNIVASCLKGSLSKVLAICVATISLFRPPLTMRTVVLSVQMFTLSFGYYGLWLWLPTLLDDMNKNGGSACDRPPASNSSSSDDCNPDGTANIDDEVYKQSFITSLSNLPGNLLTILLIDWTGRKSLLVASMILSGVSVLFIWLVKTTTETLVMMCIFGGISVIGWNVLDVLYTELYPTNQSFLQGTGDRISDSRWKNWIHHCQFGIRSSD